MQPIFNTLALIFMFAVTYWLGTLVPESADARLLFGDNNMLLGLMVWALLGGIVWFVGFVGLVIFGGPDAVEEYNKEVDKQLL